MQKQHRVHSKHCAILKKHYVAKWLNRYILGDVAQRCLQRRHTAQKHKVFQALLARLRVSQSLARRLKQF